MDALSVQLVSSIDVFQTTRSNIEDVETNFAIIFGRYTLWGWDLPLSVLFTSSNFLSPMATSSGI